MPKALHIHASDNVAVCTSAVKKGDEVEILEPGGGRRKVRAASDIAFCNKIALEDIPAGSGVVKYGEVIGRATALIRRGELANDSNIASQPRKYEDEYLLKQRR
ncbi:UxaA family hydrolase [Mesosutterella sp. OilRF-GAM-744-9]|uniref:UxaA family hydrolase n=2 Tax=Mesosutterella TaxID=2494213 RepID=A0ABS9MS73_9BURK|nr:MULTISPECIES: UxaA family hydrolase [unclassified Mesosutterella]MCG5031476.1 UxaA family hydrolase [Mesosutterella sp. oilRF-744-WT-GAM-9]MCI6529822.1 UxaA family hydrolase [Mesosutterella sp.]MDL2059597.1 UxaA family hydrolase [Mesosutterella sp. AGMB02718]